MVAAAATVAAGVLATAPAQAGSLRELHAAAALLASCFRGLLPAAERSDTPRAHLDRGRHHAGRLTGDGDGDLAV